MIVADFSIVPMGSGTSASKYVRAVHQVLADAGVTFVPGPMSTALQAESLEALFKTVEAADQRLEQMGVQRMIINIRIDHRRDKEISIDSKLGSIRI